jgi:hypothetical protein
LKRLFLEEITSLGEVTLEEITSFGEITSLEEITFRRDYFA